MLDPLKIFLKKNWQLFSILLIIWAILPLFHKGFFVIQDNEQIARLFDLNKALLSGQFPVRILPNLGFGYGYPLFNFYPPFVYYFAEIFKLAGLSFINSIKAMVLFGYIFSFLFMYLFSKEYFGKKGGIISAVAYIYSPYAAVDSFVRGAFPEFWSFVFVPAIFWSMLKLQRTNRITYLVLLSAFGAFLVITHELVAIMLIPFAFLYFIFLLAEAKEKRIFILSSFFAATTSILLSSFFWLPALLEKKFTAVNLLTIEFADYSRHFVCIRQFIFSSWGYGGSVPGCTDGISFSLGIPQLILLSAAILLVIINYKIIKKNLVIVFFSLLLILSLFLQTHYSKFIWDLVQPFSYIQFPWRFMLISSFCVSFIIGYIFLFNFSKWAKVSIFLICLVLVIALNYRFFTPSSFITVASDKSYTDPAFIRWHTSFLASEYVPKGVAMSKTRYGNTAIDISKKEIATSSFKIISGQMNASVLRDDAQEKGFLVKVSKNGLFQPQVFSFPGWKVYVNGKEVSYADNNKFKLITVPLSQGDQKVKLVFENTFPRRLGNLLSILGLILLVSLVLLKKKLKLALV